MTLVPQPRQIELTGGAFRWAHGMPAGVLDLNRDPLA
jgi:hypothetical protein